jgi:hypothetical protein
MKNMRSKIDNEFIKELLEQRVPIVLEVLEECKLYGGCSVIRDLVKLVHKYDVDNEDMK